MIYESSIGRQLQIIHHVPGLTRHASRPHPHAWDIDAWVEGDPIASEGMATIKSDERRKILEIIDEYNGKDIGDLMPAGIPSLAGFTMHLFERLSMVAPGLRSVSATDWDDDARENFTVKRST